MCAALNPIQAFGMPGGVAAAAAAAYGVGLAGLGPSIPPSATPSSSISIYITELPLYFIIKNIQLVSLRLIIITRTELNG